MQHKAFLLTLFTLIYSISLIGQQHDLNLSSFTLEVNNTNELVLESDSDWVFYSNKEKKVIFIDLESIDNTVTDLQVWNNDEDLILTEDLIDIPKNSIYELNLNFLETGSYFIQLRTYNETINKSIEIR